MTIDNIGFWKRGHQLGKALFAYSPKALRADYEMAHEASYLTTYMESMTQAAQEGKTGAEIVSTSMQAAGPIGEAQRKTREALEAFIKHHLLKGNLIGYGFEPPRKVASEPHKIAAEYWHGKINWSKAKLSAQGLEFEQIRLITHEAVQRLLQQQSDQFMPTRPQGRPSVGPSIENAFMALNEAGKIDPSASQGSHYPQVRAWLALNVPELKTPADKISDKTLYKYFSPLFKKL